MHNLSKNAGVLFYRPPTRASASRIAILNLSSLPARSSIARRPAHPLRGSLFLTILPCRQTLLQLICQPARAPLPNF